MRILYLTGGFPYPLTSGYLRHYHLIKGLSQYHDIVLVSAAGPSFKEEHVEGIAPYTEKVIPIIRPTSRNKSLARRIMKRARTLAGMNQGVQEMRHVIQRLLAEEHFDLLLLSGEYSYGAIKGLKTPPVVADMCDAKSDRVRGWIKVAPIPQKPVLWVKYWETRKMERSVIDTASYIYFGSERDRQIAPPSARPRTEVVANGVNIDYWTRQSEELGQRTIILTGAMHYPPNSDAALYLIHEILPLVRRELPDAQALIVGHSPIDALVEAGKQEGVTVTGFVDDMRPYLERATVFAAPLRFGAGIQNKVLEAMAMALPVVTTSVAADGLRVDCAPPPLMIADDAQTFAQCIIEELSRREADPTPAYEGRKFVEQHFSWASSVQRLNKIFESLE